MTIAWPQAIVDAIARRRSVLLIGSGVSANSEGQDGAHPDTWGNFLREAYKNLKRKIVYIDNALKQYDYLAACDFLKSEYGPEWPNVIRKSFVSPRFKACVIHKSIFELDSRIVVSLNFDDIYEKYAIRQSDNTVIVKNYYDDDIRQAVAGADRYVLKPHGSVDSISKMIFTLEDYAKARVENASFYEILTALLHTHTFLCVGCGLSDPDMKIIFEDYRYKFNEFPHYMTLPAPVSPAECLLIQKTRGLNVLKYSKYRGHKELSESLRELAVLVSERRNEMASSQDW